MADFSSTITIKNGFTSSKLSRIIYKAAQGNWAISPRSMINAGESDTFKLNAASTGGPSEGEVSYRTDSGKTIRVYFRCSKGGNAVTVIPGSFASINHNATGSPLIATVQILEYD